MTFMVAKVLAKRLLQKSLLVAIQNLILVVKIEINSLQCTFPPEDLVCL